jgi:hypothetical protein
MLVFRAYTNCPSWVIVTTTVQTNSPRCVLKGILIHVSGVKALKTRLFHCLPHMLGSSNVNSTRSVEEDEERQVYHAWGRSNYLSPYLPFPSALYGDCYRLVGKAVLSQGQHTLRHWNYQRGCQPAPPQTQPLPGIHCSSLLNEQKKNAKLLCFIDDSKNPSSATNK